MSLHKVASLSSAATAAAVPSSSSPKPASASPRQGQLPSPLPPPFPSSATPSPTPDTIAVSDQPAASTRGTFTPFFTLLVDPQTGEHHHPTAHYVFSDDGSDLITAAALRTLEDRKSPPRPHHEHSESESGDTTASEEEEADRDEESASASILPPRRPGVQERYVVLDISEAGDEVVSAQSMSKDWQVVGCEVRNAPTWDRETEGEGGLMICVQGRGPEREVETKGEELGELVGEYERRMVELRRVMAGVGAGAERRAEEGEGGP